MATELLLTADVKDVGLAGDVVRVSEGFARNFLIPKKLASPVNPGMKRSIAKLQVAREAARQQDLDAARALAVRLADVKCTIKAKAAKDKKLYGSVTAVEILVALKGQGIALDKSQLVLENPIKELGVVTVSVKLHADVPATLKVWVVGE